jgi:flagellar P-ring protein precursor FlgI
MRSTDEWRAAGRALASVDARTLAARRRDDDALRRARLETTLRTAADVAQRATRADVPLVGDERHVGFRVPGVADQTRLTPIIGSDIIERLRNRPFLHVLLAALLSLGAAAGAAEAQDAKIRDLTIGEGAAPIRLVGYGLAVGLDGTGDRTMGGAGGGGMTVQSVVNTLRNFNVEVPAALVRTRNVAVVLVTAEVSPYLRPGGRFDLQVASMGDARSLRGGVLYMTPLIAEAAGRPLGMAQGALVLSEGVDGRDRFAAPTVETSARVPQGGQLEADLPRPTLAQSNRLLLKEPDIATASRIAAAINGALGANTASVEDPGSVALALPVADRATALTRIRDLAVRPERVARLVIDARDGTVVAGGDIVVHEATVSHGAITLTIGGDAPAAAGAAAATAADVPGAVRVAPGTPVQRVAAALHAVQAPPADIAAIFAALREVGALQAEVVVR